MKHFACIEEFDEKKHADHISYTHGFDSRLESEYIAKLEGQIKALEQRIKALEDRLNRQG
ncbi:MAG: hypothetical protein M3P08_18620 [Thermoproteota archaeon]|nr:hypothetical protein [Thermoproteota archaeon]